MGVTPGSRDKVVEILLGDFTEMRSIGCEVYLVSVSETEPNWVWVTEVWTSKEAHGAALRLESVRSSIKEAQPHLTGEFESIELSVVGGLGA